ncbi:DNA primase [Spiroplasma endosymbiont of Anurida maritima]|uniref:DNA primase n=1 Tax=Spiroplasma endosymbiont of Anurida maritima TaxID=2967972 RepID=UPI0036D2829C
MKNNIIEKIKEKLDIVDYIGKYLTLSKKGNAHVAVCPFHEDTNPSLSINTSKQIFKCFPCGAGGDIIEFASLYNKVDFKTALGLLAKEANIDYNSNFQNNKAYVSSGDKKLLTINKLANDYFKLNLLVTNNDLSNKANDYLKNTRKIPDSIIKKFEIGVAFKNDKNFLNYLDVKKQEHEFTDLDLRKSNIIIEKNNSKYSFFSDRIIFPIKNEDKKIVAFSSRKFLPNDESAKYINSKETDVFKKDEILYNLDNAMVKIKLKDFIIICEGFMDVIALETVGIENSVAIMGTALTLKHISKISKLTKNVVLFYDNDDVEFFSGKKCRSYIG